MSQLKAGRGRPKGSGLDDHEHLKAIARLMASDPDLKPTTAIKSMGVTDPSVIRRLRDKYHAMSESLSADVRKGAEAPRARTAALTQPAPKRKSSPAARIVAGPAPASADPSREPVSTQPAAERSKETVSRAEAEPAAPSPLRAPAASGAGTGVAAGEASASSSPDAMQWMALWFGFGLDSLSTAVQMQISFVEKMMRLPHVATALRSQVAMNEMTARLIAPAGPYVRTVH